MMSNSPRAPQRIARRNVFFPVERPVPVEAGDRVQVTMRIVPERMIVVWDVEIRDAAAPETAAPRAASRHSTLLGMLVCREDLERQHPRFVPRLTPRGDARLSVLRLCDGERSLAAIEREVYEQHPDLFRSAGEASAFVAEVVAVYSL